jgi:hypothetical protein
MQNTADFQFNICEAKAILDRTGIHAVNSGMYPNFRWLKPKILIPFPLPT